MHLFDRARCLLTVCLLCLSGTLLGQEYPSRVVRIVVADTAGAASDIVVRLLAHKLSEAWGQQVIVDNRPGANGIIGAEVVAKAKPDGYTLLTGVVSMLAINQFVYKNLSYDSLRDFLPITQLTTNHFVLIVAPSLPVTSVAALVKLAKSRPGEILFASPGIGNQQHLAAEMFARAAGIKIVHVPHKGTAPALISVIGGQVAMMTATAGSAAPHLVNGRLRLLATLGTRRASVFPEAPTLVESGYPDVVVLGWTGLVAPTGTPPDIINKVSREVGRLLTAADVRSVLAVPGSDLMPSTPETFGAFLSEEIAKWSKVIRLVGLEHSQ